MKSHQKNRQDLQSHETDACKKIAGTSSYHLLSASLNWLTGLLGRSVWKESNVSKIKTNCSNIYTVLRPVTEVALKLRKFAKKSTFRLRYP